MIAETETTETLPRIRPKEIDRYRTNGKDFIPDQEIGELLSSTATADVARVRDIVAKSLAIQTLTPRETAELLLVTDPQMRQEMEQAAGRIKKKVYDNRIVTFAPLYLSNHCVNNCLYCGLRRDNHAIERAQLSMEQIRSEIEVLAGTIGHKRLIVVYGEHPGSGIDYMTETMKTIYGVRMKTRTGHAQIRRINVNAAPMPIDELKELRKAGLGTYQVFQETYHHDTYARVHPRGTLKSDYAWRLYCMHRAMEAGIDDVGIGALFGLYTWQFEVMSLLSHARELERAFGIGPHTISFPRLEPAENTPFTEQSRYRVADDEFRRAVTVIRLAVPYTGMILTARENAAMRRNLLPLGVTQTDASTRIGIGAYSNATTGEQQAQRQQFILGDTRSLDDVVRELAAMGNITSFCTAGYRCGRTGKCIMDLLRSGQEGKFCKLNAVITFREWLNDFASPQTIEAGEKIIAREMEEIRTSQPGIYPKFMEHYDRTCRGERDLYF
jgi:2-iminoacetate synthase